jgi:hypothetical protein
MKNLPSPLAAEAFATLHRYTDYERHLDEQETPR